MRIASILLPSFLKGERIETDQYLRFNKRMHKVTNLHVRIMRNKGYDFYEEQLLES